MQLQLPMQRWDRVPAPLTQDAHFDLLSWSLQLTYWAVASCINLIQVEGMARVVLWALHHNCFT
jgi:hypothetical protein